MSQSNDRISRLIPDPKYNDTMITRFVNNMMYSGKRDTCFKTFYNALEEVARKTKEDGFAVWKKALENVMPAVEVRSRRVGGATLQIPQEIKPNRKIALAMKWMILYSRQRKGKGMELKLADEIVAAYKQEGGAYKKKEDTHKMAEANKAFAHFRF